MADVSIETGVQQVASGNIMNSAALTIIVPSAVAGYGLYMDTWGRSKYRNPSFADVIEQFVVPVGFGWTMGYVAARWGGINSAPVVAGIAGVGVFVYSQVLMKDVDKELKSYL